MAYYLELRLTTASAGSALFAEQILPALPEGLRHQLELREESRSIQLYEILHSRKWNRFQVFLEILALHLALRAYWYVDFQILSEEELQERTYA